MTNKIYYFIHLLVLIFIIILIYKVIKKPYKIIKKLDKTISQTNNKNVMRDIACSIKTGFYKDKRNGKTLFVWTVVKDTHLNNNYRYNYWIIYYYGDNKDDDKIMYPLTFKELLNKKKLIYEKDQ